ncbi:MULTISPECIES: hypothetical protein [Pseudoalteromonas]|uniref:hypothetical protein n=1 Tax=Pseudoalteromonas TaxID=53246 RepID=UPI00029A0B11|nr:MULTISPECIES: hypothetical protein [Pseudoalteromonas]AUJ68464.1 hypothetical protein PNC201_00560 [Pseudoalteromonas sp. NC201]MBR8844066.1 hypothetical protein [Pseudoalteromonas sp. JC3]MCF2829334.1 hypothetical protein [Pseudoalteromonas sp. OF5H-5]MCF2832996.1 hypothetical protein [Pseudoalteromonas sp. DL2-H6]MCF2926947.1 hypothetical protein [Pseudoalteromonas sp. DL2-H1]
MKLTLAKKKLKQLDYQQSQLAAKLTPQAAGGRGPETGVMCETTNNDYWCQRPSSPAVTCSVMERCL